MWTFTAPIFATVLSVAAAESAAQLPTAALPPSPASVAIVDEGVKGFSIRHFPSRLRFYTYDRDTPGVSQCFDGCASAWPPVRNVENSPPVGEWTLVQRKDGPPQWAYRGAPLYFKYHDQPDAPAGDGHDGVWHILKNIPPNPTSKALSQLGR